MLIKIPELNKAFSTVASYKAVQDYWGVNEILSLADLIAADPKQSTFTVTLKILRIIETKKKL